jgi:GNAT superfamily N-acetyltransferase
MSKSKEFVIRRLAKEDYDLWYPLWRAYQEFYRADIPEQVSKITWHRLLDPQEVMFGAVAMCEERAVGIAHWLLHRSCWTIEDYCYLQDLFVERDQRTRGIGRGLIEHVESFARQAKCARVYWLTHETNTNAMMLYNRVAQRSGFIQYCKYFK